LSTPIVTAWEMWGSGHEWKWDKFLKLYASRSYKAYRDLISNTWCWSSDKAYLQKGKE